MWMNEHYNRNQGAHSSNAKPNYQSKIGLSTKHSVACNWINPTFTTGGNDLKPNKPTHTHTHNNYPNGFRHVIDVKPVFKTDVFNIQH